MAEYTFIAKNSCRTLQASHAVWASIWGAASGNILTNYDIDPYYALFAGTYLAAGTYHIWRQAMFFDTSTLPSDFNIASAKLRLYVFDKGGTSTRQIHVVEGLQAGEPVVTTDYGALCAADVSGGYKILTDFTADQYNDIDLNDTGLGWINLGGITQLALRDLVDIDNNPPVGPYTSYIWFRSSYLEDYEPLLIVESAGAQYPSDALDRVTGIRHVWRPGSYRLEADIGGMSTSIRLAQQEDPPILSVAPFSTAPEKKAEVKLPKETVEELIKAMSRETVQMPGREYPRVGMYPIEPEPKAVGEPTTTSLLEQLSNLAPWSAIIAPITETFRKLWGLFK